MSCNAVRIAWLGNRRAFLGSTQERWARRGLASCRTLLGLRLASFLGGPPWPASTRLLHSRCWGWLAPFTGCFGRDCMHYHIFCSKAVTGLYLLHKYCKEVRCLYVDWTSAHWTSWWCDTHCCPPLFHSNSDIQNASRLACSCLIFIRTGRNYLCALFELS